MAPVATARPRWINLRSSAGFAGATLFRGEASEGAVEAPSDFKPPGVLRGE